MRVFFIGAQGTGKTTVIRELEKLGYPCLQHITRDTISKNKLENKSSDKTTTETQSLIFDAYVKAFNENEQTFEEAFSIQHERNQYNNTVQNAINDLEKVKGWKKGYKENSLTTIGMDDGYGDCEVYNNTCNLHINNVSHEVAKKIMELIRN